jgi:limonene-1,2-epoxide hydrolase
MSTSEEIQLNCVHCGSQDVRLFKLIHEEGTSVEEIRAEATPKWNTKPFGPLGKQKIKGTRTVQTALAKRCAPPSNPEDAVSFIAAFPAMVTAAYAAFRAGIYVNSFWVGLIVFAVVSVGSIIGCISIWRKYFGGQAALESYKKDVEQWHRSWLCHKCGGATVSMHRQPNA